MRFVHEMNLPQLLIAENETIERIEELRSKPSQVRYDASNALEARLASIRNRIREIQRCKTTTDIYTSPSGCSLPY